MTKSRAAQSPHEIALDHLLHGTALPSDFDGKILEAVEAAYSSYAEKTVQVLFDACLLGKATIPDLESRFGVSAGEAEAYRHLFFDPTVFPNAFHAIAYIATEPDTAARELLREGYTRGYRALEFRFAPASDAMSAEDALKLMFEADAQTYMANKDLPLAGKSVKELRALGKHVLTTAQTLGRLAPPKADPKDALSDFMIESGPENPTLADLLANGIEITR